MATSCSAWKKPTTVLEALKNAENADDSTAIAAIHLVLPIRASAEGEEMRSTMKTALFSEVPFDL